MLYLLPGYWKFRKICLIGSKALEFKVGYMDCYLVVMSPSRIFPARASYEGAEQSWGISISKLKSSCQFFLMYIFLVCFYKRLNSKINLKSIILYK